MKELIEKSYSAIVGRGLITATTPPLKFLQKASEELHECYEAYFTNHKNERYIEELTDLATVCIMQIRHLGYDFEKEFQKVLLKNQKRAENEAKPSSI